MKKISTSKIPKKTVCEHGHTYVCSHHKRYWIIKTIGSKLKLSPSCSLQQAWESWKTDTPIAIS